jgi:hypothetical protein
MTTSTQYARIHGLDLTSVITPDVSASDGGDRDIDESSFSGWNRAHLHGKGRKSVTYSGLCKSLDPEDIETTVAEFNNAPPDCEFYPIDEDRCIYSALASARFKKVEGTAESENYIHSEFEVVTREPFCFDARQGLLHDTDVALPATSAAITAGGTEDNTINYLLMSGDLVDGIYTKNIYLTVNGWYKLLITKLLHKDNFELSRWGEVIHSYRLNWYETPTFSYLQDDLWGATYCYGGAVAADQLTVTNGRLMVPFAGPLPVADTPPPKLEFFLVSGAPTIRRAYSADLTDYDVLDVDILPGHNSIEIPECDGHSFISIGLYGSFVVSDFYAEVHRYLAESELPKIKPRDVFTMRISDGLSSNHSLRRLIADYRNKFWW